MKKDLEPLLAFCRSPIDQSPSLVTPLTPTPDSFPAPMANIPEGDQASTRSMEETHSGTGKTTVTRQSTISTDANDGQGGVPLVKDVDATPKPKFVQDDPIKFVPTGILNQIKLEKRGRATKRGSRKVSSNRRPSKVSRKNKISSSSSISSAMKDILFSSAPIAIPQWDLVVQFASRTPSWILDVGHRMFCIDYRDVYRILKAFKSLPSERHKIPRLFGYNGQISTPTGVKQFCRMEPRVYSEGSPRVILFRAVSTGPLFDRFDEDNSSRVNIKYGHLQQQLPFAISLVGCMHVEDWCSPVVGMLMQIIEQQFTGFCNPKTKKHNEPLCKSLLRCPWCPLELQFMLKSVCTGCGQPKCDSDTDMVRHGVLLEIMSYTDLGTENTAEQPWLTYSQPIDAERCEYIPPYTFQTSLKTAFEGGHSLEVPLCHLQIPRLGDTSWKFLTGTHWDAKNWKETSRKVQILKGLHNRSRPVVEPSDVLQGWPDKALESEAPFENAGTLAEIWGPHQMWWERVREIRLSALQEKRWEVAGDVPASITRFSNQGRNTVIPLAKTQPGSIVSEGSYNENKSSGSKSATRSSGSSPRGVSPTDQKEKVNGNKDAGCI